MESTKIKPLKFNFINSKIISALYITLYMAYRNLRNIRIKLLFEVFHMFVKRCFVCLVRAFPFTKNFSCNGKEEDSIVSAACLLLLLL